MHVAHDRAISFTPAYSNVTEIVLEKVIPTDEFDSEWRVTIHFGHTGDVIKYDIFDILTLTLNTKISGIRLVNHGLTPLPREDGIAHVLIPSVECSARGRSGGLRLRSNEIQELQEANLRSTNLHCRGLITLFRHAISTDEPIVQFMILYLILYELYGSQQRIDTKILTHLPNTPQSISPHNGRSETIYTSLRNELAHRSNVSTRNEVMDNLDSFRIMIHGILKSVV